MGADDDLLRTVDDCPSLRMEDILAKDISGTGIGSLLHADLECGTLFGRCYVRRSNRVSGDNARNLCLTRKSPKGIASLKRKEEDVDNALLVTCLALD